MGHTDDAGVCCFLTLVRTAVGGGVRFVVAGQLFEGESAVSSDGDLARDRHRAVLRFRLLLYHVAIVGRQGLSDCVERCVLRRFTTISQ